MASEPNSGQSASVQITAERCIKPDASDGPGLYLVLNLLNGSSRKVSYDLSESTSLPLVHLLSVDVQKPADASASKWTSRAVEIGSYMGPSGTIEIRPGFHSVLMVYLERQVVKEVNDGRKLRVTIVDSKRRHETASSALDFSGLPGCTLN